MPCLLSYYGQSFDEIGAVKFLYEAGKLDQQHQEKHQQLPNSLPWDCDVNLSATNQSSHKNTAEGAGVQKHTETRVNNRT